MKPILWLALVMGYGLFTWAAEKRTFAKAALCFLDGGYLAFLCFALLPHVMGTAYFFLSAAAAGVGVLVSLRLEGRKILSVLILWIVTGCQLLWQDPLSFREVLLLAFFGGLEIFCLGIIGEYIGQIFNEVKGRPRYIKETELL